MSKAKKSINRGWPPRIVDPSATKPGDRIADTELQHLKSHRYTWGDPVWNFPGDDRLIQCTVAKNGCIETTEVLDPELWITPSVPVALTVAISLCDQSALREAISNAVSLGVQDIRLVQAEYSKGAGGTWTEKLASKIERWVHEVRKQAGVLRTPTVQYVGTVGEFLQDAKGSVVPLHVSKSSADVLSTIRAAGTVLIGPEGGWSQSEIQTFADKKLVVLQLPTPVLTVPRAVSTVVSMRIASDM